MPRKRKITVEEAWSLDHAKRVFEHHNLDVAITGIRQPQEPQVRPQDLFELDPKAEYGLGLTRAQTKQIMPEMVRVDLRAAHQVGSAGELLTQPDGTKTLVNNGVMTYGPGTVYVKPDLAAHLAHQDMLAIAQDARTFAREARHHVVGFRRAANGGEVAVAVDVTNNPAFINDGMDLMHFGLTLGRGY